MKDKCRVCNQQERILKQKEIHIYSYCKSCGAFIKFVAKDEVEIGEVVIEMKPGKELF